MSDSSNTLYIHPTTKKLLARFIANPAQALIVTGPEGIGLTTIARYISREMTGHEPFAMVDLQFDDKKKQLRKNIGVDQIRSLKLLTRGKSLRQVVIIRNADHMSEEAQNAFLKVFEEPHDNLYFILLAHDASKLKPTIHSRAQHIDVLKITDTQTAELLASLGVKLSPQIRTQILFVAQGLPAEVVRLVGDEAYRRGVMRMNEIAKQWLSASMYERLAITANIKTRDEAQDFLKALSRLTLFMTARKTDEPLMRILDALSVASDAIAANGHIRMQLTNLCLR